jgi:Zn-dependent protease/CBS domain-containing protein
MSGGFNLGKVFGIEVRLHYTWFIIFILVTVSLVYPNWSQGFSWGMGILTSLLFFASVLAHELAHSLVGRANDIPIKSITLFIFGGVAQMTKEATKASAEFKMAAAGPACSLVIGGLFGLIWFLTKGIVSPIAEMAGWLAFINVALAVFNLIPGFPLDGGRVFRSLMWRFSGDYKRSTKIATRVGQGVAYAFMGGGILMVFLLQEWISGLWLVFIGWFLQNAASSSYRQAQWQEALRGVIASQVMTPYFIIVPPNTTLTQLVRGYVLPTGQRFFLVANESGFKGILTLRNIKSVPQSNWDMTPVEKIMVPADRLKVARPEQDALSIIDQMNENDINQMPVLHQGKIVGIITRDNLIRALRTRTDLGM